MRGAERCGRLAPGWARRAVIVVGVVVVVAVGLSACGGTSKKTQAGSSAREATAARKRYPPEVALFGDSLAWEAEPYYRKLIESTGETAVFYNSHGGTAICDYLPRMRELVDEQNLEAAQIAFSGNALTPCMKETPAGTPEYFDKYRADALAAVEIFKADHTRVFLIGAPITRREYESNGSNTDRINQIYADIAAADPTDVSYVHAGAAAEGLNGSFVETLPCLIVEPCTGPKVNGVPSNVVRSRDGGHFCPVESSDAKGVIGGCPVYSSGAFRYANAMVEALEVPEGKVP